MKTVWRVQDAARRGPYIGGPSVKHIGDMYGDNHPGPHDDRDLGYFNLPDQDNWSFGFATLTQFKAWCATARLRRSLRAMGYVLVQYRVEDEDFRRSNFQAVFRMRNATQVAVRHTDYCNRSKA